MCYIFLFLQDFTIAYAMYSLSYFPNPSIPASLRHEFSWPLISLRQCQTRFPLASPSLFQCCDYSRSSSTYTFLNTVPFYRSF